jgi:general secretion pathway protein L
MKGESAQVEDLLARGNERLGANGVLADAVFVPAVGTALRGLREACFPVNLLPGGAGEAPGRTLPKINAFLTALLLIGLIIWGGSYPIKDEIRFRHLQRETGQLGPSVEALSRKEEELKGVSKDASFLSKMGGRKGEILMVLEELSKIVPNSAYFSILRYRQETIEVRGNAENASNLVPTLERSPLFKNVGFNAPSKRARDNRETFSLKAEIER